MAPTEAKQFAGETMRARHVHWREDAPSHRILVSTRDEVRHRIVLQTWRSTVVAAHDAALRLWMALDSIAPEDVHWEARVTPHTPGVYDGDDWFEVTVKSPLVYGPEGADEIAHLLHDQRDRWLPAEESSLSAQPRGSHAVSVQREVVLVHCLHCDDLFHATTVWRRCDCCKVSARVFVVGDQATSRGPAAAGHRAVSVKTLEPARFAVFEGNIRSLDSVRPGGELKLLCVRKETGQDD